jgi:hypothetical protein
MVLKLLRNGDLKPGDKFPDRVKLGKMFNLRNNFDICVHNVLTELGVLVGMNDTGYDWETIQPECEWKLPQKP